MSVSNLQDPSQIPSGIPPDGVTPNFIDPESVGYIPRDGIYVLLPLAIAALLCRIGTRLKLTRTVGLDDVICIIATAITVAYCAVILPRLGTPLGRHQWDVPLSQVTNGFVRDSFTSSVLQNLAIMFIKLSILVFYLKIFEPVPWARIAIWIGLAAVLLFYIILDIVLLALCVPSHGQTWLQMSSRHGWVATGIKTSLAAGWFGTIADIYIIAIPTRLVSTLNLNRKHKFGVMAIFLTGLAACGCSAAGLAQRYKLSHDDMTYNDTLVYMYSICEVNIAIICSCMPAFTAPIKVVTTRILSSWNLLKQHTETILSPKEKDSGPPGLPGVPGANISGLRTFIRRFNRSTFQQTTLMADGSNFSKIESVDEEYHRQLRALHGAETNTSSRPSAPVSRG